MQKRVFTPYHTFIIAILTILQFTIVLDFMVLSPLGVILLKELEINTAQFGMVVSAYAFSAGASGLLAAGFADKFDRKKLLLFFYVGFVIGTLLCGLAPDYNFLLMARIVTGIFGGVISSITYAIVTDLFPMEVRGRVMGFLQMAFAGSQILGLPIGLHFANLWGWHFPFLMIVGLAVIVGVLIVVYMKPINEHLNVKHKRNAIEHLYQTLSHRQYVRGFLATVLLSTAGFMLMPFGSTYTVNNLGISLDKLPLLYFVTGICSMIAGPFIGKLSDRVGKFQVFCIGTVIALAAVLVYCNLGITPLWMLIIISVVMFIGVSSRMISSQALLTAVPELKDRGAFMSINASVQQISGGVATIIAGMIIVQTKEGMLENYSLLGFVIVGTMLVTIVMMYSLYRYIQGKLQAEKKSVLETEKVL